MPKPTTASSPAARFGLFRYGVDPELGMVRDARVRVRRVVHGIFGQSDADLELDWTPIVQQDATVVRVELTDVDIAATYGPTGRCAVGILPADDEAPLADIKIVAHGYLDARTLQFGSSGRDQAYLRRTLKLRDILQKAALKDVAQIQGRHMLSRSAWDTLAAEDPPGTDPVDMDWAELAKLVRALPCVFNPKGKPNRMARPVMFDPGPVVPRPIHLFTYEGDPNAQYWTYLQALRYLVRIYLPYMGHAVIDPGNLFTEACQGPDIQLWWPMAEEDVPVDPLRPANSWLDLMVRRADNLTAEGLNIREAIELLCRTAGVYGHVDHVNAAEGEGESEALFVESELHFWAPGDPAPVTLGLERGGSHFDELGAPRDVADILEANNVVNANLQLDYGNALHRVRVIGDRKWRIIRAELKPLWKPEARWDNVAEPQLSEYRDDAYLNPFSMEAGSEFFHRYSPDGDRWGEGQNQLVGRLWGLDTSGEIAAAAAAYNRPFGYFTDYSTPWEFPHGEAEAIRRRRAIQAIPTVDGEAPLGVILEMLLPYELATTGFLVDRISDTEGVIELPSVIGLAVGMQLNLVWPGSPDPATRTTVIMGLDAATKRIAVAGGDGDIMPGEATDFAISAGEIALRIADQVKILPERSAVYIMVRDLLAFGKEALEKLDPPLGADNYYDAYMQDAVRLRAYLAIETDEVCEGLAESTSSPVEDLDSTKLLVKSTALKLNDTDDDVPDDIFDRVRDDDDGSAAGKLASGLLATRDHGQWQGQPQIPWIEEDAYPLGSAVSGIARAVDPPEEISFGANAASDGAFPVVTQKVYLVEEQTTVLTLDDQPRRRGLVVA